MNILSDSSLKRLEDAKNANVIRNIIETQFNLEIYLKEREIQLAHEQIGYGEDVLQKLYALIINGDAFIEQLKMENPQILQVEKAPQPVSASSSKPSSLYSSPRLALKRNGEGVSAATSANQSPSSTVSSSVSTLSDMDSGFVSQLAPLRSTRDRESRSSLNRIVADKLYARRDDGSFVYIRCSVCHRTNFSNMQGFVNHSRLAHKIEYPTHEAAIKNAGVSISSAEIAANHPVRNMPLKNASYNTGKPWERINHQSVDGNFDVRDRIFIKEENLLDQIDINSSLN